ncbi:transposase of ISPca11, Y1_Tnp domain-containing [Syntrophotalea carbinolica DSM 2380]|uniref:Transposase of ISPca11, Y1_Tnp domain-containing n=1 Tax=Syntrophotalea carbinolica (strain DSM 2380 / NBRC 103641 / GraBd1) TaxID=338963 RepID=Q3A4I8_SYNC1|nr:transposase [Syntrophotalea carbinolica]ABA88719.1 transposase of ISPca11, Y1_Tnp domain-containing [Syntrophotalea carbinolica DSM 2380]
MANYRRTYVAGGRYFFTVNCAERRNNRILVNRIDLLRKVFRKVKADHPFHIDAIVVLPEHLHCIWTLPPGDSDYKTRWSLIKAGFSRQIGAGEYLSESRGKRGERGIWQRRYWEHFIRDDPDYRRHVDYIHWNPVKHGWVTRVIDWPYSSFHDGVKRGLFPPDWAAEPEGMLDVGEAGD